VSQYPFPALENELLADHTTYRIGGPAEVMAFPRSREDLWAIGAWLKQNEKGYFVLGNGSNMLCSDEGYKGLVLCTRDLPNQLDFLEGDRVSCGAGLLNSRLLRGSAQKGIDGFSVLAGVPGNIGGAVFMNAGAGTGWIDDFLLEAEAVDLRGGARFIKKDELRFTYRQQHFLKDSELIFAVILQGTSADPQVAQSKLADGLKKRKAAQPIEMPSCGSVFRNPEGTSAWKCIESVGLRGKKVGGARFSEKHCNFIVNEGGATQADVLNLIGEAKRLVKEKLSLDLHEEVVVPRLRFL
jgi:UDP-N-acetylmuramate dehydrogenase